MNRKTLVFFGATTVLAALLAFETGNARRNGSDTSMVSIDGRAFLAVDPSSDDGSALRRELARLGVELPDDAWSTAEGSKPGPIHSERLVPSGKPEQGKAPEAPAGLRPEHELRMSGTGGTVELVLGRIEGGSASAAARLEADRWTRAAMRADRGLPTILRKHRGKETDIVCLDEKEGVFLLLRRMER